MEKNNIEIERKYIIEKPDAERLRAMDSFTESRILQIYLSSPKGITHRIRARESDGVSVYTETKKIRIDAMSSTEIESEIDAQRFSELRSCIREGSVPIEKTRCTFIYRGQLFELDFYPEWERTCIMETELDSRERVVDFPDVIRIVRDVTGVKEYSNSAMSMKFPLEDEI